MMFGVNVQVIGLAEGDDERCGEVLSRVFAGVLSTGYAQAH
jgi:hypothetical protein